MAKIVKDKSLMDIKEFVKKYNALETADGRAALCRSVIKRKYVPILEKYSALLIGFSNAVRTDEGHVVFNGVMQYVLNVIITLEMYTNLDFSNQDYNKFDMYDLLQECGALKALLLSIDKEELEELNRITATIVSDTKENELNPYAYVSAQINKLNDIMNRFVETVYGKELAERLREAGLQMINGGMAE